MISSQKIAKKVSKGATIFQKILEDKKAIQQHLANGGTFDELKDKGFNFVQPL